MIRVNEVRGAIAKKGLSQRKVAKMLGISEKTFYAKMKNGIFRSDELERLIILLEIENPSDIFFAIDCTSYAPDKERP